MFKNLYLYCETKRLNVFDIVPVTFLLEVDSPNYAYELEKYCNYFSYIEKLLSNKSVFLRNIFNISLLGTKGRYS